MHTKRLALAGLWLALGSAALGGCSSYHKAGNLQNEATRTRLQTESRQAMAQFLERDLTLDYFFNTAHGYAVFPRITKGGAGIGAAHGRGEVYEQGDLVGWADMSHVTLGPQLGGQTYTQLIFFEDEAALNNFKGSNVEFSGQASAVAVNAGGAAAADYKNGVAIFIMVQSGLMFEASVGGQKFHFVPREAVEVAPTAQAKATNPLAE